jgi:hypothetical protein
MSLATSKAPRWIKIAVRMDRDFRALKQIRAALEVVADDFTASVGWSNAFKHAAALQG